MMDAAFSNPYERRRLSQRSSAWSVSMESSLTEPEFAQAVAEGLPRLIAIARRLTGNEEIASEAVQNALLKAAKSWRRFRGEAHVNTWLTQIVIHAVRDAMASERRRTDCQLSLTPQEWEQQHKSPSDDSNAPDQQALNEECRRTIQNAVFTLPDRQREVFSLMVWQGMTAREVGILLDIVPQTVHANLHAARKRLRELLSPYLADGKRPPQ